MTLPPRFFAVPLLFLATLVATSSVGAQGPTYPFAPGPQEAGDPPPVPGSEGMMVQPRGPVHEAFAVPFGMAARPGPLVTKQPPPLIPEIPPEQRPEGDNVQWIPGYWAWDAERQDYLWISGLWRVPPGGRRWVPGTWNAVEGGYRWTPGIWLPAAQQEMPNLPPPPASLDQGPTGPQPGEDSFYVPGNWMYQSSRYRWQPGYWQTYRPGMLWTPAAYSWTPNGYLYVPGYWDWPLANRGLLFAPVVFTRPLWRTPGWTYQPNYCLAAPGLLSALFLGRTGNGFYFGNYYGPTYRRLGYQPWFAGSGYNPLLNWYRWRNLANPRWLNGLSTVYRGPYNSSLLNVQPLSRYNHGRLTRLNAAQRNEYNNLTRHVQQLDAPRAIAGPRSLPLPAHAAAAAASGILPAQHLSRAGFVPQPSIVPRLAAPTLPRPAAVHSASRPAIPRPAPIVHPAPATVHHASTTHHSAPPARVFPAQAHHAASARHGGGNHGGGHRHR